MRLRRINKLTGRTQNATKKRGRRRNSLRLRKIRNPGGKKTRIAGSLRDSFHGTRLRNIRRSSVGRERRRPHSTEQRRNPRKPSNHPRLRSPSLFCSPSERSLSRATRVDRFGQHQRVFQYLFRRSSWNSFRIARHTTRIRPDLVAGCGRKRLFSSIDGEGLLLVLPSYFVS